MTKAVPLYVRHKDQIRKMIIEHKFGVKEKALRDLEAELADKLYNKLYGGFLPLLVGAPPGAFAERVEIRVKIGEASGSVYEVDLAARRRFFEKHGRFSIHLVLDYGDPLSQAVGIWNQEKQALAKEKQQREREVDSALEPYRTFSALLKNWPEIAPFVAKVQPASMLLPTKDYTVLNNMLDLPPELVAV